MHGPNCYSAPYLEQFKSRNLRRKRRSGCWSVSRDPNPALTFRTHSARLPLALDIYAQTITPAKLEAQGTFLNQLLKGPWMEKAPVTTFVV